MSRSFFNDIPNFSQELKPVDLKHVLKIAFSRNLDSFSNIESHLIKKNQIEISLKVNTLISLFSLVLATLVWGIGKFHFKNDGLDTHFILINLAVIWAVFICNHTHQTTKNITPSNQQIYKYLLLNIPNIALSVLFWGYLPAFIDQNFGSGNQYGAALFVAISVGGPFWGLPFFQLGLAMYIGMVGSFIYHYSSIFSGDPYIVLATIFTLCSGLVSLCFLLMVIFSQWVRRQVLMEHRIHMGNLFLSELESKTSVWLWRTDEHGKLVFFSDKIKKQFKIDHTKSQRKDLTFLFDESDPHIPQLIGALASKKSFTNIQLNSTVGGKEITWGLSGKPIYDEHQQFFGFNGIGTDITKQHEAKKIEQQKVFYDSFTEISSTLSHDFNNLLAGVTLRLEHIQSDLSQSSRNEFIQQSLDLCNKAANITSKMLAYSKKESLNMTHFSLDATLKLLIDQHKLLPQKTVQFELTGREDIYIHSDESLLHNALTNIINNAIRATQDNSTIYINRSIISISDTPRNTQHPELQCTDYVHICIEDSGPGFLKSDLEKGFNPFYTRNRESGGSGLGLSMVKGFALQTGGEAFISNGKRGAKVELFLPHTFTHTRHHTPSILTPNDLSALKILLVEDNISFGDLLNQQLTSQGYMSQLVYSVRDAIQRLDEDDSINLVITDFLLPDGKGSDIVRYARTHNKDMNAMYISGYLDDELKNPAEKATVLRKPFTVNELINCISDVVNKG